MLSFLAQYQSNGDPAATGGAACVGCAGCGLVFFLIMGGIALAVMAGFWKTFEKAGKPGWAALIPIYNIITLVEIAGKEPIWVLLFFIPIWGAVIIGIETAKRFGKGTGFGVLLGLFPFIFYPILGFGSAQYQGGPPPTQTGL